MIKFSLPTNIYPNSVTSRLNQTLFRFGSTYLISYFNLCCLAIFIGAFLLFQVQPLVSKILLPWHGGAPTVWSTCLVFFQSLLLFGYYYAHVLNKLHIHTQIIIHTLILLLAALTLPISPDETWKPMTGQSPSFAILSLLGLKLGLPYFALATSAPLIQAWFHRSSQNTKPYRLYSLSNAGSLLALLSYPLFVEKTFNTSTQSYIWSILFIIYAFLMTLIALKQLFLPHTKTQPQNNKIEQTSSSLRLKTIWTSLPILSTTTLLAITNHICQDITVIPFLWVAPLAIYLLTYILCFASSRWYHTTLFCSLTLIALLALTIFQLGFIPLLNQFNIYIELPSLSWDYALESGIYLLILFFICMVAHGELAKQKPHPSQLTHYFLFIALGGAIGGALVALIFPIVLSDFYELNFISIISTLLCCLLIWLNAWQSTKLKQYVFLMPLLTLQLIVIAVTISFMQIKNLKTEAILTKRNFYGAISVYEYDIQSPLYHRRMLYHGRILHGMQLRTPSTELTKTKYYQEHTGIDIAMRYYPVSTSRNVGVIGLGAGTMAAFGNAGDYYRFYEINPQIIEVSQKYFSFLQQSPATSEIIPGDARLSLEREAKNNFDILVVDAFSGDAVPVHLLTKEAFALYLSHLKHDGILIFNTTNRHLDLSLVVASLALDKKMGIIEVEKFHDGSFTGEHSRWVLVTNNLTFRKNLNVRKAADTGRKVFEPIYPWTDQYSSLLDIYNR